MASAPARTEIMQPLARNAGAVARTQIAPSAVVILASSYGARPSARALRSGLLLHCSSPSGKDGGRSPVRARGRRSHSQQPTLREREDLRTRDNEMIEGADID